MRDLTMCAGFGDDSRDERTYCNDVLHENSYAWLAWLSWVDGSTPNAFENSITPPGRWDVTQPFMDVYGTLAAYKAWTMLRDPLAKKYLDQYAKYWNANCGHPASDFPGYPPAYDCTTYFTQPAIANGNHALAGDTGAANTGFMYNTAGNGQFFGSIDPTYTFTAGSGQVLVDSSFAGLGGLTAGDLVQNVNTGYLYATNSIQNVDQLDPTVQYKVIGPTDNTAHTFYIQCPSTHVVDATCPTPGAAFTGFTMAGTPLSTSGYSLKIHAQFDDGTTNDPTYPGYVMQAIEALQVAGYNMSAALGQGNTRFGVIQDPQWPSHQLDATVVVP